MNSQQPFLLPAAWQNMYGLNPQAGATQLLQQQQQQLLHLSKLGMQLPQQQIPLSINGSLTAFPGLAGGCMSIPGSPGLTLAGSQLYPIMSPQLGAYPSPQPHPLGLQQTVLASHPAIPGLQKLFMPSVKAKLETKALKAKRPGFTDDRYSE